MVVPPLMLGQFLVAEAQSKAQKLCHARCGGAMGGAQRRSISDLQNWTSLLEMAPKDWNSGDIGWLIGVGRKPASPSPLLKQLQETTFKGRPVKMRSRGKDGKRVVTTITGQAKAAT